MHIVSEIYFDWRAPKLLHLPRFVTGFFFSVCITVSQYLQLFFNLQTSFSSSSSSFIGCECDPLESQSQLIGLGVPKFSHKSCDISRGMLRGEREEKKQKKRKEIGVSRVDGV